MAADLVLRLTGGVDNADPARSLGGARSGQPPEADLFDAVDAQECLLGDTEHRAVDVTNAGNQTARQVELWAEAAWPVLELGLGRLEDRRPALRGEDLAPVGVAFGAHGQGDPLTLPEIPPGQGVRLWLRRPVAAGAGAVQAAAVLLWRYV